ncbi:MAG: DNA (cytosine-5-)-methyltransferase [Malacoplasma sp.]|nr:DNA (cytosine-5-)-methyltransferase [Malacoplasma sp.]
MTVKLFEFFAGIGSQYKALKNISKYKNWMIQHVGMVEWFVDAIIAYVCIHSKNFKATKSSLKNFYSLSLDSKSELSYNGLIKLNNSIKSSYLNYSKDYFNNLFNIEKITYKNIPKNIDILTYSFPCQDLSVQGLQKGIDKKLKTRSGLLWEVERILIEIFNNFKTEEMPKYLLMENVKNLLNKTNIKNYQLWINQLKNLGYESKTYVLNSKNFNSAQSRERVFCLSVRKDFQNKVMFKFIDFKPLNKSKILKDVLKENNDYEYIDLSNFKTTNWTTSKNGVISKKILNWSNFNSENYIYSENGVGPTLTASGANSRIKIETNKGVRYMSSLECYQYMGFSELDYLKVKNSNLVSDTKLIYTAGNSIPVEVLECLFATLKFRENDDQTYIYIEISVIKVFVFLLLQKDILRKKIVN